MERPPVTPYTGPFAGEARAFVGKLSHNCAYKGNAFTYRSELNTPEYNTPVPSVGR